MGDAEPQPAPVVRVSDLAPAERDRVFHFLLEQDIQFYRSDEGKYIANVRMVAPDHPDAQAPEEEIAPAVGEASPKGKAAASPATRAAQRPGKRGSRPPAEMARMMNALSQSGGTADYSIYPKFSSLIASRRLEPKKRPLSWLMRLIEEVYDARFAHDTADLRDEPEGDEEGGQGSRLSNLFPVFLVDFFSKRYGLRSLVAQTCWDLLYNTHALRKDHLEVEVFARFLEEFYDPDDLLFFLYVRNVIQKEIGINFRNRWTELARGRGRARDTVWLSYRACLAVARIVFGSESDPLCRVFLESVDQHVVGSRRRESDSRRIEVVQFLHLALVEYHNARPGEGDTEEGEGEGEEEESEGEEEEEGEGEGEGDEEWRAAVGEEGADDGDQPSGPLLISSRAEQEALFREAHAQFEERMRRLEAAQNSAQASVDDAGKEEVRAQEMEAALRQAVRVRRSSGVAHLLGDEEDDEARIRAWATRMQEAEYEGGGGDGTLARAMASASRGGDGEGGVEDGDVRAFLDDVERDKEAIEAMERRMAEAEARAEGGPETRDEEEEGEEEEDGGDAGVLSEEGIQARREVLLQLSEAMHEANGEYLDHLLGGAEQLPGEVAEEIRSEAQAQLEGKVETLLGALVREVAPEEGTADAEAYWQALDDPASLALRDQYQAILGGVLDRAERGEEAVTEETAGAIQEFCQQVLQTPALRQEIEPFAALLITYATARFQGEDEGEGECEEY